MFLFIEQEHVCKFEIVAKRARAVSSESLVVSDMSLTAAGPQPQFQTSSKFDHTRAHAHAHRTSKFGIALRIRVQDAAAALGATGKRDVGPALKAATVQPPPPPPARRQVCLCTRETLS